MKRLLIALALAVIPAALQAQSPAKPLSKAGQEARRILLDDERKAEAFYAAVIAKHGDVVPFSHIIEAERRHQSALEHLFEFYGIPVPENTWTAAKFTAPERFRDACLAGVQAEVENVALYDAHLKNIQESNLRRVFERLRWASQERHLPAFKRFAEE
ncbi:MAG: DUF2202 domain-containing protein [Firmicutes bacterium]|nr:DUF2202 domain-containing protein [Bacillota bacterium]